MSLSARIARACGLLALLTPSSVKASPDGELRGFIASRLSMMQEDQTSDLYGLVPESQNTRAFLELNVQPGLELGDSRLSVQGDLSLYASTADPTALMLINEAYVDVAVTSGLELTAGRKRLSWGSGLAANPTDLLNPPRNPLEPEQQRTGAFLALAELSSESASMSAGVSAPVETDERALPERLRFDSPLVVARVYSLLAGTDFNFIYYLEGEGSHQYGGLSLSRFFGDHVELHAEALVGDAPPPIPAVPHHPSCPVAERPAADLTAALISGGRYQLLDGSFVALEHLYSSAGFSAEELAAYKMSLPCVRTAMVESPPPPIPTSVGHPVDTRLILLRRHYGSVMFQRPHLTEDRFEDVSVVGSVLTSLEAVSVVAQLRVGYRFAEGANVSVSGTYFGARSGEEFEMWPHRFASFVDLTIAY